MTLAHPAAPPAAPLTRAPLTRAPLTRASDAERNDVVARLHHALGEGRLDLAETDVRVASAYAACHRNELSPLLADLPDETSDPHRAPTWAELWTSLVWRARIVALDASDAPPTPAQCRTAAAIATLATLWMVTCAFLGAALVAS